VQLPGLLGHSSKCFTESLKFRMKTSSCRLLCAMNVSTVHRLSINLEFNATGWAPLGSSLGRATLHAHGSVCRPPSLEHSSALNDADQQNHHCNREQHVNLSVYRVGRHHPERP
jgi:hypothetical protein